MARKRPPPLDDPAAALPAQVVEPFETAEAWAAHLAGLVEALAPAGALEAALVERVAALLWRLRRLDRWEGRALRLDVRRWHLGRVEDAAARAALLEQSGRPDLAARVPHPQHPDDVAGSLGHHREALRALGRLVEGRPADRLTRDEATAALFALALAADVDIDGRRLAGLPGPFNELEGAPRGVACTVALGRRWAAALARAGKVAGGGRALLDQAHTTATQRHAEAHRAAVETTEALARAQAEADRLPPRWAEAAHYEAHLSGQLAQALGQLDRLQARRTGGPGPLDPAALDLGRLALPGAARFQQLEAPAPSARALLAEQYHADRALAQALDLAQE